MVGRNLPEEETNCGMVSFPHSAVESVAISFDVMLVHPDEEGERVLWDTAHRGETVAEESLKG